MNGSEKILIDCFYTLDHWAVCRFCNLQHDEHEDKFFLWPDNIFVLTDTIDKMISHARDYHSKELGLV